MVHWQPKPSINQALCQKLLSGPLATYWTHDLQTEKATRIPVSMTVIAGLLWLLSSCAVQASCSEYFISKHFKSHLEFSVGLKMSPTLLGEPFLSSLVSLLSSLCLYWHSLTSR